MIILHAVLSLIGCLDDRLEKRWVDLSNMVDACELLCVVSCVVKGKEAAQKGILR